VSWLDRDGSTSQDREALQSWHQDRRDTFAEGGPVSCDDCGEQVGVTDWLGTTWTTEAAEVVQLGSETHRLVHVACMRNDDQLA